MRRTTKSFSLRNLLAPAHITLVVQGIEFRKDKGVQSLGSPTGILRVKIEISIFLKQVEAFQWEDTLW